MPQSKIANPYPTDGSIPVCVYSGIPQADDPNLVAFVCCVEKKITDRPTFVSPECHFVNNLLPYLKDGRYPCCCCGTLHDYSIRDFWEVLFRMKWNAAAFLARWGISDLNLPQYPRITDTNRPKKNVETLVLDYFIYGTVDKKEIYMTMMDLCASVENDLHWYGCIDIKREPTIFLKQNQQIRQKMCKFFECNSCFSRV